MEMAVESMEMAPGAIPRPGRVPEQRLLSPESRLRWWRRGGTFRGLRLDDLGFSRDGEYMGGEATRGSARGGPTTPGRGLAWPAPGVGVATPWHFSVSPSGSRSLLAF